VIEAFHQGGERGQKENEASYEFEDASRHWSENSGKGRKAANPSENVE
jgi:hypothetical protein